MANFILGLMFLPAGFMIWFIVSDMIRCWRSVKKYGGENPRILNWYGKELQKLFQKIQGKPVDRPRTPRTGV